MRCRVLWWHWPAKGAWAWRGCGGRRGGGAGRGKGRLVRGWEAGRPAAERGEQEGLVRWRIWLCRCWKGDLYWSCPWSGPWFGPRGGTGCRLRRRGIVGWIGADGEIFLLRREDLLPAIGTDPRTSGDSAKLPDLGGQEAG